MLMGFATRLANRFWIEGILHDVLRIFFMLLLSRYQRILVRGLGIASNSCFRSTMTLTRSITYGACNMRLLRRQFRQALVRESGLDFIVQHYD